MPRGVVRLALKLVCSLCHLAATALMILTVLGAVVTGPLRAYLIDVLGLVSTLLPEPVAGVLVYPLPLGGAVRGDFILTAVLLLLVSHFITKYKRLILDLL